MKNQVISTTSEDKEIASNKLFEVKHEISFGFLTIKPNSRFVKILLTMVSLIVLFFMVYAIIKNNIFPYFKHAKPSICVILPDWELSTEGSFYQDGAIQQKGFEQAIQDARNNPNNLKVTYLCMKKDDNAQQILDSMKTLYQNGTTFFIMTMSSKILEIKPAFVNWYNECKINKQKIPILITTVASAPNIADLSNGILRFYVRSEEESSLLAMYFNWKLGIKKVGIFFITRRTHQADDSYGKLGCMAFKKRFNKQFDDCLIEYPTNSNSVKENVSKFLEINLINSKEVGVFVVGYGEMVRNVLNELILNGFSGPIACTSTLTEPDWQPIDTIADCRIFTVMPKMTNQLEKMQKEERNIVFYFAKEVLSRVIKITSKDSNSQNFITHWMGNEDVIPIEYEVLANGDCIIQLDVVSGVLWR